MRTYQHRNTQTAKSELSTQLLSKSSNKIKLHFLAVPCPRVKIILLSNSILLLFCQILKLCSENPSKIEKPSCGKFLTFNTKHTTCNLSPRHSLALGRKSDQCPYQVVYHSENQLWTCPESTFEGLWVVELKVADLVTYPGPFLVDQEVKYKFQVRHT